MKTPDQVILYGGHNEDVFAECDNCCEILGVDPETLAEVLRWAEAHTCGLGSAEECSAERSRAPGRQPVAPAEGRAWETPATRTV